MQTKFPIGEEDIQCSDSEMVNRIVYGVDDVGGGGGGGPVKGKPKSPGFFHYHPLWWWGTLKMMGIYGLWEDCISKEKKKKERKVKKRKNKIKENKTDD
ncbi:hypothetical protein M0804_014781 [Polistes exclamans]|nr:hypothetical protein M0804_014783 [Polistes exclamans]KAI4474573.1 hypothetical protein M0804_014781 [Polistes exclamans]